MLGSVISRCTLTCAAVASLLVFCGNQAADADEFEASYGVDITSDYISKGSTQTEGRPAIQPYVEVSNGMLYAGLWASNVRFDGVSDLELDVYAGITPSWRAVDFDIGFAQYLYRDDSTDYGEAIIAAEWAVSDPVTLGLIYYREVYADEDWLYLNASLSELPWELTLSGGIGSDFGSRDLGYEKNVGDIGIGRDIKDNASIDLHAYVGKLDSELNDEKLVLTLSFFN